MDQISIGHIEEIKNTEDTEQIQNYEGQNLNMESGQQPNEKLVIKSIRRSIDVINLQKKGIRLRRSFTKNKIISLVSDYCDAHLLAYQISIGFYAIRIQVINIEGNAPIDQKIGSGSFGSIILAHRSNTVRTMKRTQMKYTRNKRILNILDAEQRQLYQNKMERIMVQVVILKMLDLFQVGPQMRLQDNFDIVTYSDAVEFEMEKCIGIKIESMAGYYKLQSDLKQALRIMHHLHIIHGDIKPQNIMFSPAYNRYVFIDFGCSRVILQSRNQQTRTHFFGTPGFCSAEMEELQVGKGQSLRYGKVNLYSNDYYGLCKTLSIIRQGVQLFSNFNAQPPNIRNIPIQYELNSFYNIFHALRKRKTSNIQQNSALQRFIFSKVNIEYTQLNGQNRLFDCFVEQYNDRIVYQMPNQTRISHRIDNVVKERLKSILLRHRDFFGGRQEVDEFEFANRFTIQKKIQFINLTQLRDRIRRTQDKQQLLTDILADHIQAKFLIKTVLFFFQQFDSYPEIQIHRICFQFCQFLVPNQANIPNLKQNFLTLLRWLFAYNNQQKFVRFTLEDYDKIKEFAKWLDLIDEYSVIIRQFPNATVQLNNEEQQKFFYLSMFKKSYESCKKIQYYRYYEWLRGKIRNKYRREHWDWYTNQHMNKYYLYFFQRITNSMRRFHYWEQFSQVQNNLAKTDVPFDRQCKNCLFTIKQQFYLLTKQHKAKQFYEKKNKKMGERSIQNSFNPIVNREFKDGLRNEMKWKQWVQKFDVKWRQHQKLVKKVGNQRSDIESLELFKFMISRIGDKVGSYSVCLTNPDEDAAHLIKLVSNVEGGILAQKWMTEQFIFQVPKRLIQNLMKIEIQLLQYNAKNRLLSKGTLKQISKNMDRKINYLNGCSKYMPWYWNQYLAQKRFLLGEFQGFYQILLNIRRIIRVRNKHILGQVNYIFDQNRTLILLQTIYFNYPVHQSQRKRLRDELVNQILQFTSNCIRLKRPYGIYSHWMKGQRVLNCARNLSVMRNKQQLMEYMYLITIFLSRLMQPINTYDEMKKFVQAKYFIKTAAQHDGSFINLLIKTKSAMIQKHFPQTIFVFAAFAYRFTKQKQPKSRYYISNLFNLLKMCQSLKYAPQLYYSCKLLLSLTILRALYKNVKKSSIINSSYLKIAIKDTIIVAQSSLQKLKNDDVPYKEKVKSSLKRYKDKGGQIKLTKMQVKLYKMKNKLWKNMMKAAIIPQ